MNNKSFEQWLKEELSKPASNHYDPNGNSSRAVASRGLKREIIYQYKKYPSKLADDLKSFEGIDTPISYFLYVIVTAFLFPVIPVFVARNTHKRALSEYKVRYERSKNQYY